MFCPNCGEKFHQKPNYCTHCGFDLRQASEEKEVEPAVEEKIVETKEKEEVVEAKTLELLEAPLEKTVDVVAEEKPVEKEPAKVDVAEHVPLQKSFFAYDDKKTELTRGDHILKNVTYILSISIVIALIIFYFALPAPSRVFDLRVGSDYAIVEDGYRLIGGDSNVLKNDGNFVYRLVSNQAFGEDNYDVILEKVVDQKFQVVLNEHVSIDPEDRGHFQEVIVEESGDYRLTITMGGKLVGVDHFSIR